MRYAISGNRRGIIWKYADHRRQVADVAVDDAEESANGILARSDTVEIAHLSKATATDHPALVSATMQVP